MLFIDYSSELNTIVPSKLGIKRETLGLDPALCNWGLDFLSGRPQVVRVGNNISTSIDPQHWGPTRVRSEPSPVLPVHTQLRGHARLQLNHQVCRQHYSGRLDYQQRRDGLQGGGEGPRSVVSGKYHTLNVNKIKEMIVDFRKQQRKHPTIHIDGTVVERVVRFKFLGVHITDKLNWSTHTDSVVKKAAAPLQPQEAEEIWLVTKSTHKLLQMYNREHPVGLYHRLVRQLLRPQP